MVENTEQLYPQWSSWSKSSPPENRPKFVQILGCWLSREGEPNLRLRLPFWGSALSCTQNYVKLSCKFIIHIMYHKKKKSSYWTIIVECHWDWDWETRLQLLPPNRIYINRVPQKFGLHLRRYIINKMFTFSMCSTHWRVMTNLIRLLSIKQDTISYAHQKRKGKNQIASKHNRVI